MIFRMFEGNRTVVKHHLTHTTVAHRCCCCCCVLLKTCEKTQWRKVTDMCAAVTITVTVLLCYCVNVLQCYCVHTVQKSHSHGCCCYCVHLQIKPSLQFPFTEWLNFCLFWKSSFFFCDPLALLKLPFSFKLFFRAEGWIFISCCYKNSKCAPMSLLLLGQADFFFFI